MSKKKKKKNGQGSNPGDHTKEITTASKPEDLYKDIPGREDDYENLQNDYGQEYEEDAEEEVEIPQITEFGRISAALMPLFHEHWRKLDKKCYRALLGPYGLIQFLVTHDDLFEEDTYKELLVRVGFLMNALGKVTAYVNEYDAMRHSVSVQAKGIDIPHSAQNISLTVAQPIASQQIARSGGLVGAVKRVLFGKAEQEESRTVPNPKQVSEGTVPTTSLMVSAMQITPMLNHVIQLLMQKRVLTNKLYGETGKGKALRLSESSVIKGILLNAVRMLGDNATAARDYGQSKILDGIAEIVGKEVSTVTQPITQVFTKPVDVSGRGFGFPTIEEMRRMEQIRRGESENEH